VVKPEFLLWWQNYILTIMAIKADMERYTEMARALQLPKYKIPAICCEQAGIERKIRCEKRAEQAGAQVWKKEKQ